MEYLHSGDYTQVKAGVWISPSDKSIMAVVDFFTVNRDHQALLQSDIEEIFVPKSLWSAAVGAASEEDGGGTMHAQISAES